jgi:PQQ-dependent catabolism-associated CXXCW motif protein
MHDYRSPVPDTLHGATLVNVLETKTLHENGDVIFIDVLPAQRKPEGLQPTDIWLPKPHKNIPGSTWLPDVGYGVISDAMEQYFKENLERLTENDKSKKILVYCRADCWMSWNAAKRALSYGYTDVYWFPDGTDDWSEVGFDLQESSPLPLSDK